MCVGVLFVSVFVFVLFICVYGCFMYMRMFACVCLFTCKQVRMYSCAWLHVSIYVCHVCECV